MERISIFLMISFCLGVTLSETTNIKRQIDIKDLDTEASAKFLDLGNLFNRNPYQNQYYSGSVGRPYGSVGYGGVGYSGNIPYNTYGNRYPNSGAAYPNYGGSGYGGSGYSGGFYPSNVGSGYGTNVLGGGGIGGPGVIGLGGYGGYGGNGGLQSYYGYFDPGYYGSRNLGYGYYPDTNRYGFIDKPSGYRGYN